MNCVLCKSSLFIELPYFYLYRGSRFRIVRRTNCGLATLCPMLSRNQIESLYNWGYFERDYHCGASEFGYRDSIWQTQADFRPYLSIIRTFSQGGVFLEIGCAGGATLAEARAEGFTTVGVELFPEIAEWGRSHLGLDIRSGSLEAQKFPEHYFDVVYLGDVIEHLPYPKASLREIKRILKPGGVVALAYPMELNHFLPRLRMLLQWQRQSLHKPYHLFYYNTVTLRMLLEQCGFEVKFENVHKIIRPRPIWSAFLDSLNYWLTKITGKWGDRGFTLACSV